MLRSTRLSDKAIKTLLVLGQRTGQLQLQERINLDIMISSRLSFHIFVSWLFWTLLCGKYTSLLARPKDENKSVVNRSSVDRRGLLESC